jgi:hypothetical protein
LGEQRPKSDVPTLKPYFEAISLPPGFVLVALPVIGYAIVFAYEYGICTYFQIPPELIRLDLTTGFVVATSLGSFSLGLSFLFWFTILQTMSLDAFVRVRYLTIYFLLILGIATYALQPYLYVVLLIVGFFVLYSKIADIHQEDPDQKAKARQFYERRVDT